MRILGLTWNELLIVMMFDYFGFVYLITISRTNDSTLGESIFGSLEHLKERSVSKMESDWKKYYGSCPELKEDIERIGKQHFSRVIPQDLHKTKGKTYFEETRQHFIRGVLTESLDTGGPAYYNSNILNRYFRKDYYDGD